MVSPPLSGTRRWRMRQQAFTLVEVMVSMVILLMMMLIITSVIGTAQKSWRAASSRLTQFREARNAFDTITLGLRQATMNPYRDYDYGYGGKPGIPPPGNVLAPPVGYVATADLGFAMGKATKIFNGFGSPTQEPGHAVLFQAPLGYTAKADYRPLNNLLCVRGYFVMFDSDLKYMPSGLVGRLEPKSRFRLYEYQPTTESNPVFDHGANAGAWLNVAKNAASEADIRPVAENILTLVLAPSFTTTGAAGAAVVLGQSKPALSYDFNSYTDNTYKYRLPSSVQVVMVAMDEESAVRLSQRYGTNAPQLFNAPFNNPAELEDNLREVRNSLTKLRVNFRIFNSSVYIPAADK